MGLAYESLKLKKNAPTILNAANEVAVDAFLTEKIEYLSIPLIVEKTLNKASIFDINSIQDVIDFDVDARIIANELINTGKY